MQNNHSFALSKYQTRSKDVDNNSAHNLKTNSNTESRKKLENPIQALRDTVKSEPQAEVCKAKNNAVKSLPDHIVIIFDDWNTRAVLVQDILTALELDDKPVHIVSASEPTQQFSDYALIWQQGESIALQKNVLTTPRLKLLTEPATKRLLWQCLTDYVG
jgi:DNA polymerase III psi subunit